MNADGNLLAASGRFSEDGARDRTCGMENALLYRSTLLVKKGISQRPYRRPVPRVLGGSKGGGHFLMGEVPLYYTIIRVDGSQDTPTVGKRRSLGPVEGQI